MRGDEMRRLREGIGLTMTQLGGIFYEQALDSLNTQISRFETGTRDIPTEVAVVLRMLAGDNVKDAFRKEINEVEEKIGREGKTYTERTMMLSYQPLAALISGLSTPESVIRAARDLVHD